MKKQPLRKCAGCGEMKPKRELIRVVRSPEQRGEDGSLIAPAVVLLDLTGKKPGRGAYLCHSAACLEQARKARRLERSLSCKIEDEVFERLTAELTG